MTEATSQITQLSPLERAEPDRGVGESLWTMALRRLRHDRLSMIAIIALTLLTLMSISAPLFAAAMQIDPDKTSSQTFSPPGINGHILGTDDVGRDHLVRLMYAGQISLGIAFVASALSLGLGIALGIATGYYGGVLDDFMVWLVTTIDSIPSLYLLLLISRLFRLSPFALVMVFGLLGWTGTMRLVRGETLSLRDREFVIAARSIGTQPWRLMAVHLLPNVLSIIIVTLALNIGGLILTESALSFLGFGVKPPTASWGFMLADVQNYFTKGPWLVFWPGLLIMITVLCLYILGDGLRDAFDPKLKERA